MRAKLDALGTEIVEAVDAYAEAVRRRPSQDTGERLQVLVAIDALVDAAMEAPDAH
jgi:hypothetical protein